MSSVPSDNFPRPNEMPNPLLLSRKILVAVALLMLGLTLMVAVETSIPIEFVVLIGATLIVGAYVLFVVRRDQVPAPCGQRNADDTLTCGLYVGHNFPHVDKRTSKTFTHTLDEVLGGQEDYYRDSSGRPKPIDPAF